MDQGGMDDLDTLILRELIVDPYTQCFRSDVRISYKTVADKLRVDEDTVRNRIEALEGGLLSGWRAGINPRAIGCDTAFMLFDVNPGRLKGEVLQEMNAIPGMIFTTDHLGEMVSCLVAYRGDEAIRKIKRRLSRISNAEIFRFADHRFPECSYPLTKTDLEIIDAMQTDPRRAFREVAKEVGLSTRTVRRRVQKLTEGNAVFILPVVDMKAEIGGITANLIVEYSEPEARTEVDRQILARFDKFMVCARLFGAQLGWFLFHVSNTAKLREMQEWPNGLSGVAHTYVLPMVSSTNLIGVTYRRDAMMEPAKELTVGTG